METAHDLYDRAQDAAEFIRGRGAPAPTIGIVLGSGLGDVARIVDDPVRLSYTDIPNFPVPMAPGHAGELLVGPGPGGVILAVLVGRIHLYEGYTVRTITFPLRALQLLGTRTAIITNAAGGINDSYQTGDLVAITDQINMSGGDPLVGENDPRLGARFLDMTRPFDPVLLSIAQESAADLGIPLHLGTYVGVRGPTFETRAEIEHLRRIGADSVGMSTVNEVIAARHAGMRVLGLSVISNVCGVTLEDVAEEVLSESSAASETVARLLSAIISRLAGGAADG